MCSLSLSIRRILLSSTILSTLLFCSLQARALGPHGDLFGGYSHLSSGGVGENGWQVDGHLKLVPFLGAEAGVSGYSQNGGNGYLYLFGPRATVGIHRVHLFAHFLVGAAHSPGANNFIYGGGGGLDLGLISHVAWRFEGDGFHEPNTATGGGRFATGPVLRF